MDLHDRGRNPHPRVCKYSNRIRLHLRAGKEKGWKYLQRKGAVSGGASKARQNLATCCYPVDLVQAGASQLARQSWDCEIHHQAYSYRVGVFRASRFRRTTMHVKILACVICFPLLAQAAGQMDKAQAKAEADLRARIAATPALPLMACISRLSRPQLAGNRERCPGCRSTPRVVSTKYTRRESRPGSGTRPRGENLALVGQGRLQDTAQCPHRSSR